MVGKIGFGLDSNQSNKTLGWSSWEKTIQTHADFRSHYIRPILNIFRSYRIKTLG